jgi:hypothetical protein
MHMHDTRPGVTFALLLAGFVAAPLASAQSGPDFLLGDWTVTSEYVLDDGSTEQTTAVATAAVETISGSTTQIRQTLVGIRDGQELEVAATFAVNPLDGSWVMMQADSVAGTADVTSGVSSGAGDVWTFTSFPATRPDGGLDRFVYSNIAADSYVLTVSRSFDGGATWEVFRSQTYSRATAPVVMEPLPGVTTCNQPEYGQFDFWLGDWDLVTPAGQSSGDRSRVQLRTGDCVVEETFMPVTGGGVSRSMYDARTGEWARVWLEPGRMLIFVTGGLDSSDMITTGGTTGTSQLTNRTIWQPQAGNQVRQFTQTSNDNGITWSNSGFDAVYVPQGSPPPPPPPPPRNGGGGGGGLSLIELLFATMLLTWRQTGFRRRHL